MGRGHDRRAGLAGEPGRREAGGRADDQQTASAAELTERLRSERYLTLLDRLVSAARSPKLATAGVTPTGEAISNLTSSVLSKIIRAASRVTTDGSPRLWDEAWKAMADLDGFYAVTAHVVGPEPARWRKRLDRCRLLLDQVHAQNREAEELLASVEDQSPQEAFDAGRRFERDQTSAHEARAEFLDPLGQGEAKARLGAGRHRAVSRLRGGRRRRQDHPGRPAVCLAAAARGASGADLRARRHADGRAHPSDRAGPGHGRGLTSSRGAAVRGRQGAARLRRR